MYNEHIRALTAKKYEILGELEMAKAAILREMSTVDGCTLTKLREIIAHYDRLERSVIDKVNMLDTKTNVFISANEKNLADITNDYNKFVDEAKKDFNKLIEEVEAVIGSLDMDDADDVKNIVDLVNSQNKKIAELGEDVVKSNSNVSELAKDLAAHMSDASAKFAALFAALPNAGTPDITLDALGGVPKTRTINGKALDKDITLTADDLNIVFDNGESVAATMYRVGDVKSTARSNLGEEWLLCNGEQISADSYPKLAEIMIENQYLSSVSPFVSRTAFADAGTAISARYIFFEGIIDGEEVIVSAPKEMKAGETRNLRIRNIVDNVDIVNTVMDDTLFPTVSSTYIYNLSNYYVLDKKVYLFYTYSSAVTVKICYDIINDTFSNFEFTLPTEINSNVIKNFDAKIYLSSLNGDVYLISQTVAQGIAATVKMFKGNADFSEYEIIYSLSIPEEDETLLVTQANVVSFREYNERVLFGVKYTLPDSATSYYYRVVFYEIENIYNRTPLKVIDKCNYQSQSYPYVRNWFTDGERILCTYGNTVNSYGALLYWWENDTIKSATLKTFDTTNNGGIQAYGLYNMKANKICLAVVGFVNTSGSNWYLCLFNIYVKFTESGIFIYSSDSLVQQKSNDNSKELTAFEFGNGVYTCTGSLTATYTYTYSYAQCDCNAFGKLPSISDEGVYYYIKAKESITNAD